MSYSVREYSQLRPTVFCKHGYMVSLPVPCVQLVHTVARVLPCTHSWPHIVSSAVPPTQLVYTVPSSIPRTHYIGCSWYERRYQLRNSCTPYRPRYRLYPICPEPVPSVIPCIQHVHKVLVWITPAAHSLEGVSHGALWYQLN